MVKFILNPLTYCITSSNYTDPLFIGVGTSNPNKLLDVVGIVNVAGLIYNNNVPFSGGTSSGLWSSNTSNIYYNGSVGIGSSSPISALDLSRVRLYTNTNYGRITLARASDSNHTLFIDGTGFLGKDSIQLRNGLTTAIECGLNSNALYTSNGAVLFNKDGSIGIGTTLPLQKLHITNTSYLTSNLGIGTYLPNYKLHIYSTSTINNNYEDGGFAVENTSLGSAGMMIQNANTSNQGSYWYIGAMNASLNIVYGNSNNTKLSIQNTGNIGIGTTLPTQRLHVEGQTFFNNDHLVYGTMVVYSNLTTTTPSNIIPTVTGAPHILLNNVNKTNFTTYLSRSISTLTNAWWTSASSPLYSQISMTKASSETHIGGLLLPGGRVLFIPYTSNKLRIFDPYSNSITTTDIPSGTALFSGGVVLKNGRVILAPYTNNIGYFNPTNNSYTVNTFSQFNSADFRGAVLGTNGFVYFMPFNSIYSIGIYNPTNNVFGVITTTALPLNAYYGGVLIPDGRIVCVPHSATSILIIDTVGSYSLVGTTPGNQAFAGGVLLPNGKVLFVPYSYSAIGFFDPNTNTYSELSITVTTGSLPYFHNGVLTADGRVILTPYNSRNIGVYNISTHTYREITTSITNNGVFGSSVVLLDGRVLLVPYSTGITNAFVGVLSGFPKLHAELCYHPSFNKV